MAFDLNNFLSDIFKDVNVDKSVVTAAFSDPAVLKRLEESAMRQSDYSRSMNDLQTKVRDAQNYYEELKQYKTRVDGEVNTYKAQADSYRKAIVDAGLDPAGITVSPSSTTPAPKPEAGNYVSKDEWQKMSSDIQTQGVTLMAKMASLTGKHMQRFKDVLDTEGLVKLAMDKGVPIDVAYDLQIQPLVEKERAAELERIKKEAFQEGEKAALAKATFPADYQGSDASASALDYLDKKTGDTKFGWQSAVEAHQKSLFANR
jgi:hypothetical protein